MSKKSLWYPYAQMQGMKVENVVTGAEGVTLHFSDGTCVIDAVSMWWCVIHGYNHPELNNALLNQAEQFSHVMLGGLTHAPAQKLAQ